MILLVMIKTWPTKLLVSVDENVKVVVLGQKDVHFSFYHFLIFE